VGKNIKSAVLTNNFLLIQLGQEAHFPKTIKLRYGYYIL